MMRFLKHIAVVMLLLTFMPAGAQNNPYKIKDELYALFTEAQRNLNSTKCLEIAEKMSRRAIELKDKKAECMAATVPLQYCSRASDADMAKPYYEKLKQLAKKHNMLQYYYYAHSSYAIILLNTNKTAAAYEVMLAMDGDLKTMPNDYGYAVSLQSKGNLYNVWDMYETAETKYKAAYEYMKKNVRDQRLFNIAERIASALEKQQKYEDAIFYYKIAKREAKGSIIAERVKCELARLCYYLGDKQNFYKYYNDVIDDTTISTALIRQIKYCRAMLEHSYSEAVTLASDNDQKMAAYEAMGDYKSAYEILYKEYKTYSEDTRPEQLHRIIALKEQWETNNLNREMLELGAKEREAANERLRIEYVKDSSMAEKLRVDAQRIASERVLDSIKAEESQARSDLYEAEQQNRMLEAKQMQSRESRKNIVWYSLFILSCFFIAVLIYFQSSRKRITAELAKALKESVQSDRVKSMFIQNMSHDIRSPLGTIVGAATMLADKEESKYLTQSDRETYGQLITTTTGVLTGLLDDLLHISDLESGNYKLEFGDCNIDEMCKRAITMIELRKRVHDGVELRYDAQIPEDFVIYTDSLRVGQVLNNFLTNACRYTTNGSITLRAETAGSKLRLSVTDTGPGIPKDKAEVIFNRFERLDTISHGTGLGLPICRELARLLGGKVWLDTSYRAGARFVFEIPLKA